MQRSKIRRACSWHAFVFSGIEPYLAKQDSGVFPASTAISVAVTSRRPPSAMLCTAPSKNIVGFPYGSKSMASNRSRTPVELYISVMAFASLASTMCSTLFKRIFSVMDRTALADRSFAMIFLMPGTSFAYRMLLSPVADSASSTRRPTYRYEEITLCFSNWKGIQRNFYSQFQLSFSHHFYSPSALFRLVRSASMLLKQTSSNLGWTAAQDYKIHGFRKQFLRFLLLWLSFSFQPQHPLPAMNSIGDVRKKQF